MWSCRGCHLCIARGPAAVLITPATLRVPARCGLRTCSSPLPHPWQARGSPAPPQAAWAMRSCTVSQPASHSRRSSLDTATDSQGCQRSALEYHALPRAGTQSLGGCTHLISAPHCAVQAGGSARLRSPDCCSSAKRAHSESSTSSSFSPGGQLPSEPLTSSPSPPDGADRSALLACAPFSRYTAPREPSVVTSHCALGRPPRVDNRASPRLCSPVQAWPPAGQQLSLYTPAANNSALTRYRPALVGWALPSSHG